MTRDERDLLERFIDRYSLPDVLDVLAQIAGAKAEHIATNWQDARLARQWERCARRIDEAEQAARHWLP